MNTSEDIILKTAHLNGWKATKAKRNPGVADVYDVWRLFRGAEQLEVIFDKHDHGLMGAYTRNAELEGRDAVVEYLRVKQSS